MIEQAQRAFSRDLPSLLKEHPGQWVAYHGDSQVGCANTDLELYDVCRKRGISEDEFIVLCVEPETGVTVIGARAVG